MKAVVPVAGVGTNLRPHTFTQPKPLIPVAGKPIVGFIIDSLLEAGIDDFIFVIGYLGDKIREYVDANYPQIKHEYIQQERRMGLGHAVWMTRDLISDSSEVVISLGDTIVDVDLNEFLRMEYSALAIKKVTDPRKFGVVELGEDGFVSRVVEKPSIPKSNLAMVGLYKIKEVDLLIETLSNQIESEQRTHGEFQLTDAIQQMIVQGSKFVPHQVNNWFDCGRKEILLETNAMMLSRNPPAVPTLDPESNSVIIPPVVIGENCKICNSVIGPYVSIGSDATIDSAVVDNSIIGSYATISKIVLNNSVVGQDATVTGMQRQLNIGDNTEIELG